MEDRSYRPAPYHSFHIHEPKRRLISAAPFRDRVVHHALCNIIEPRFERGFVADSFANRIGKGTHRALLRAQALARRYRYVLQLDGIPFLGFVVYPDRMPLKRRKVVDYRRRLRSLVQQPEDSDAIQASYAGWEGHARVGSTVALRRSMECMLPERVVAKGVLL